jgi:hypothetical protein
VLRWNVKRLIRCFPLTGFCKHRSNSTEESSSRSLRYVVSHVLARHASLMLVVLQPTTGHGTLRTTTHTPKSPPSTLPATTCQPTLLAFPSGHFDVISARTLYELLKTSKPLGRTADEYDLCLKECYRCLKSGGVFEYNLLDADMIHAGRNAQAMGVEFGFNLKTRGYDAQCTKTFLPRLNKAGFKEVKRTWMVLPAGKTAANWREELNVGAQATQQEKTISANGDVEIENASVSGTTLDAAMLTGIVGSWSWERWLLKLQMEMGKDEERLLEGVVQMLEECAQGNAAWRTLTGYARK